MTARVPAAGDAAPEVTLLDRTGRPWRLRDLRGRTVVLIFHRHIH